MHPSGGINSFPLSFCVIFNFISFLYKQEWFSDHKKEKREPITVARKVVVVVGIFYGRARRSVSKRKNRTSESEVRVSTPHAPSEFPSARGVQMAEARAPDPERSSLGGATCGAHKKGQYLGMAQEG